MLLSQANQMTGAEQRPGSRGAAWVLSQLAPLLIKRAAGKMLFWVWKDDPELVVAMAQVQEATPQMRAARAMMPMEFDDTENFPNPYLGVGEKLVIPLPDDKAPPRVSYTWDTGSHLVVLTALCSSRERFGTILSSIDDLARTLRLTEDLEVRETNTLRIEPA